MTNRLPSLKCTVLVGIALSGLAGCSACTGTGAGGVNHTDTEPQVEFYVVGTPTSGAVELAEAPAYFVLRHVTIGRLRQSSKESSSDVERTTTLLNGFAALTVVAGAMIEGAGLFGLVGYLVSGNRLGLFAAGVAILLLLIFFPAEEKVRRSESSVTGSGV
ncbi:MAG: hypothetical protein ACYTFA_05885 [Planctomycetota bacterium]|jgi:hypothetical protein